MKIFFFLFPVCLFAQEKITPQYIDSKITEVNALSLTGKHDLYLKGNEDILEKSKQIHYSKGITLSYLNLSNISIFEGNYKKSLEYLNQAKTEKYTKDDVYTEMKIKHLISYNYIAIGLYTDAVAELKEVAELSDKITVDSIRIYNKASIFIDLGVTYRAKGQFDSATLSVRKAINILPHHRSPKMQNMSDLAHLALVEVKIDENKIDSADIYLSEVEAQSKKLTLVSNAKTYQLRGIICERRKDYASAISFYKKALELTKETKNIHVISDLNRSLSQVYLKINDKESYRKVYKKLTSIKDSLNTSSEHSTENIVKELVTKKEEKLKSKSDFLVNIIIVVILLIIVISVYIFKRARTEQKVLNEKNQEVKLLNKKLNIDFEEVVRLAKNNDPEFLNRFQEAYPDFFPKLLKIEPKMLVSELRFCALLFLNFSSKDIAQYTLLQPQSVQTKKNRLRKKLRIPSNIDIYIWMKDINFSDQLTGSLNRSRMYSYTKYYSLIKKLKTIIKVKKQK